MPNVEYVITVRHEIAGGVGSAPPAVTAPTPTDDQKKPKTISAGQMLANASYHYAKQALGQIVTTAINTVGVRTGNNELQARISFAVSAAKSAYGVIESAATGAALTGNAAGGLIGATAAVAAYATQVGLNMYKLNLSRSVESVSLSQQYIRAGAAGNREWRAAE